MSLYNVKITAIRKVQHTDLSELYENPIEHACDVREGDSWIAVGGTEARGTLRQRVGVDAVVRGGTRGRARQLLRRLDEEPLLRDDQLQ